MRANAPTPIRARPRLARRLATVAACAALLGACGTEPEADEAPSGGAALAAPAPATGPTGPSGPAGSPPAAVSEPSGSSPRTESPDGDDPVDRLSTAQLIGQRLIASFRAGPEPPPALVARIRRGELAGVILFAENATTLAQARRLTRRLQAIPRPGVQRRLPLLVMVDQEGGLVRRLTDAPPARSALAAATSGDGADAIRTEGRRTGRALRGAGVNVDLAPVSDVPRRGSAMLTEQRTYGRTAAQVRRLAPAFAAGLVAGGVQATAKHFPGFGAAAVNTDDAAATVDRSAAQLRAVDERAALAVVAGGAGLVMLANATYPALDPRWPATLSRAIATTELRERAGFDGVSITDDLEATGLDRYGSVGEVAERSARAGVDLLLHGRTAAATEQAAGTLGAAVSERRLSRAALRTSARRVLALRLRTAR